MFRQPSIYGLVCHCSASSACPNPKLPHCSQSSGTRSKFSTTRNTTCDDALDVRLPKTNAKITDIRRRGRRSVARVLLCLTLGSFITIGLLAGGCALPKRTYQPSVDPARLDDVRFLHYLATVPAVTVDEGMRGVLMLGDTNVSSMTFPERSAALQRQGAIRAAWGLERDRILDQGTLAHMLCAMCALPLSINQKLATRIQMGERRYALKVCIDGGLMPYGLPHAPVSGGALLSSLTAAGRRIAIQTSETP